MTMSGRWYCLSFLVATVSLQFTACVNTIDEIVYRDNVTITQDGQTIMLGGLFSVHLMGTDQQPCGPLLVTDTQLVEGMVLAIRMINNDSMLLPNIKLTFEIRDTCATVNYALRQSFNYIQDISGICSTINESVLGTSGVVGPEFSTISEPTANFFRLFEIPQISYASTAAFLSESRFDYFFRTIPPDFYQARALADLVVHFDWTYIIALHSDDLYGRDGIEAFASELKKLNTNTTRRCVAITIELRDDNFEEALDMMSQEWVSNASVALLFGHPEDATGILRAVSNRIDDNPEFPLQNITWIASDSWGDRLPREFRPMARGMLGVVPQINPIRAFDDYFTSLNPQNNPNPWFIEYWEEIFNCSLGLSPHLEDCDLDNQRISRNTTGYSQFSQVPLVFDAVYAFAHSIQNLINDRCPNGDLCSEISTNGAITGELLRNSLLNVSFISPSQDLIFFDENGDVQGAYKVLNLQRKPNSNFYKFNEIGTWDVNNYLSVTEEVQFVEGNDIPTSVCSLPCKSGQFSKQVPGQAECCFTCEPCPENSISIDNQCVSCSLGFTPNPNRTECIMIPVTYLTWSNPWAIAILILTCIGIVATTFVIVIFLVYYKHELIRASSRELSVILLEGIFLCYILPFFYIARPSAAVCAIRRFGVGFCFAVSFSALLVRTNRIHRIFNRSPNISAVTLKFISPLSQVLITFAFIGVQVVIAVISLSLEPPSTLIISSLTQNELVCGESPYIGLSVSLGYNFFLLVLCTYFAFLTRKVPENFNEAKFINVTVYTILVTWLAFVPTYFATVNLGTVFQTSSLAFGIILSASTTLCCLFISKIFFLFSKIREERKRAREKEAASTDFYKIN